MHGCNPRHVDGPPMPVFIEEEAVHEHSRVERVRLQADLGCMLTDLAVDDIVVVALFVSMKSTKVTAREGSHALCVGRHGESNITFREDIEGS